MFGCYVHIPFCDHICSYCDFVKERAKPSKKALYIEALLKEINRHKDKLKNIKTLYIGGGTPSSLAPENVTKLLKGLAECIELNKLEEITLEANPEDISYETARLWKSLGINRISVGVQTFDPKQLAALNRHHVEQDVLEAIKQLKLVGFKNISIDLLFSLPNQTLSDVVYDLTKALTLDVTHISYYNLILEEGTRFYRMYQKGELALTSETKEAKMFETIIDTLKDNGFEHYEISNFAKPTFASKHNLAYWLDEDYIGFGVGAHSKYQQSRSMHLTSVKHYIEAIHTEQTPLTIDYPYEGVRDAMIMGMRLTKGVHVPTIEKRFDVILFERYPKLNDMIDKGLVNYHNDYLYFTRKGLFLGNQVFMIF